MFFMINIWARLGRQTILTGLLRRNSGQHQMVRLAAWLLKEKNFSGMAIGFQTGIIVAAMIKKEGRSGKNA